MPKKPAKPVYTWSLLCRPDDGSRFLLGTVKKEEKKTSFCIDNSMISSDIRHKFHKWYFKIVMRNFTSC